MPGRRVGAGPHGRRYGREPCPGGRGPGASRPSCCWGRPPSRASRGRAAARTASRVLRVPPRPSRRPRRHRPPPPSPPPRPRPRRRGPSAGSSSCAGAAACPRRGCAACVAAPRRTPWPRGRGPSGCCGGRPPPAAGRGRPARGLRGAAGHLRRRPAGVRAVTGEAAFGLLRLGRVLLSASSAAAARPRARRPLTLAGGRPSPSRACAGRPRPRCRGGSPRRPTCLAPERRQPALVVATTDPAGVGARGARRPAHARGAAGRPPHRATRGGIIRTLGVKRRFGEFAVRLPYGEDWIEIDPAWRTAGRSSRGPCRSSDP
jgi:hypothetical protein